MPKITVEVATFISSLILIQFVFALTDIEVVFVYVPTDTGWATKRYVKQLQKQKPSERSNMCLLGMKLQTQPHHAPRMALESSSLEALGTHRCEPATSGHRE